MTFEEALKEMGVIICGPAERETVEDDIDYIGGKACPVKVWRRYGLCKYIDKGREVLADWATFCDAGSKLGISRSYTIHKNITPTEEERAAGRKRIQEVATQALIEQGIWR